MLERSDVEWPLWRKKVDSTFLKGFSTPLPKWVQKIWDIEENYTSVRTRRDPDSNVTIKFQGEQFGGSIVKSKAPDGFRYRLFFQDSLGRRLQDTYVMSYMRVIEAELTEHLNNRQIESEISFWEFLDIEFNIQERIFLFTPSFIVKPQFPNLFNRLVNSAPVKAISASMLSGNIARIHKQDWKPRAEYRFEVGAHNVIYMLLDTESKLLYVGEAGSLKSRFDNGHPDIKNWDYYKYNVLPEGMTEYRLAIERMLIRDLAALLDNKQDIAYTGANRTSIPALSGHPFRFNPDTDSGINQPVFV